MLIDTDKYLSFWEKQLTKKSKRKKIKLSLKWVEEFKDKAGVYALFEDGVICYVGETGSLRARMNDIRNTHVIRRNIANKHFSNHKHFEKIIKKKKYHKEIEELLNKWVSEKLEVSAVELNLGRRELEEMMFDKYQLKQKYNTKGKRKGRMTKNEKFMDSIKDFTLD